MKHHIFSISYLAIAFIGILLSSCSPKAPTPNLVFILTNQQSFDMLGCYGNTQIKTPRLDAFSNEALRLTNCFSNSAMSTPYQGMLMSGQHPLYNGCFTNNLPLIPGNGKKFGEVLRDAGFNTAFIGKWDLSGDNSNFPIPKGALRYGFNETFYVNISGGDKNTQNNYFWNEEGNKTSFTGWELYEQTNKALTFLDTRKGQPAPFALFVSLHAPYSDSLNADSTSHLFYDVPEELLALYNADSINVRAGTRNTAETRRLYHNYMAMVSGIDKAFGEIIDKLTQLGFDKNTVIVFTSDHGDMLEFSHADTPAQYPHDYATRVPFLIKHPNMLTAGNSSSLLFGTMDIMPTILGLLHLKEPQEAHGRNLAKAIQSNNENAVASLPLFLYSAKGFHGIVTPNFTYAFQIADSTASKNVLFDRIKDPYQLQNEFNNPAYSTIKNELHTKTVQWMEYYKDGGFTSLDLTEIMTLDEWAKHQIKGGTLERPIYKLKKLHGDRIMNFHGNNNYD